MAQPPRELTTALRERILKDMQPSSATIASKSALAVLLGGLLSLLFCGQFGVALTSTAQHVEAQVHAHVHDVGSALLFGAVFAILPAILLRLLSSPVQFRRVVRRSLHAPLLWLVAAGAVLARLGHLGGFAAFGGWCLAAALSFVVVARGLAWVVARAMRPTEC